MSTDQLPVPMYALQSPHRGASYFAWEGAPKLSPLGVAVASILSHLYGGLYHLPASAVKNARWDDPLSISISVHASHYATWDFGYLTRLVVMCHDMAIRCELGSSAPGMIKLTFHARGSREGATSQRHPTMEQHVEQIRGGYTICPMVASHG